MKASSLSALIVVAVFALFSLFFMFLAPLHFNFVVEGSPYPEVFINGEMVNLSDQPLPAEMRLVVKHTDDKLVQFVNPRTLGRGLLDKEDFKIEGDWDNWEHGKDRIQSVLKGSVLRFEGFVSGLKWHFYQDPNMGSVEVIGKQAEFLDLGVEEAGFLEKKVESTRRLLSYSVPFFFRGNKVVVQGAESLKEVRVHLLFLPDIFREKLSRVSEVDFFISPLFVIMELLSGIKTGLFICFVALIFVVLCWWSGFGFIAWSGRSNGGLVDFLLSFSVGLSFLALLSGMLGFVFPLGGKGLFVFGFTSIVSLLLLKLSRRPRFLPRLRVNWILLSLVGISTISALLQIWPMFASNGWFIGHFFTDTYDYINLGEQYKLGSVSHFRYPFGFGLRFVDFTFASLVSDILGVNSRITYQAFLVAFGILTPLAGYAMARLLNCRPSLALIVSALVGVSVVRHGLWVEGYFSRYVFTSVLVFGILASVVLARRLFLSSRYVSPYRFAIPFALVKAFLVSVVPPFVLSIPAFLLMPFFFRERSGLVRILRLGVLIAVLVLLFANINLNFLLYPDVANAYIKPSNGLAKYIVFPFYQDIRFLGVMTGISPFHLDSSSLGNLPFQSSSLAPIIELQTNIKKEFGDRWPAVALFGFLLVCFGGFIRRLALRHRFRSVALFIGLFVALNLLVVILTRIFEERVLYIHCNFTWTAGSTLMVILLSSLFSQSRLLPKLFTKNAGNYWSLASGLLLFILFVVFANTMLLENYRWLDQPMGKLSQHNHMRAVSDLVNADRDVQDHSPAAKTYSMVGQFKELKGTNTEWVLGKYLNLIMFDKSVFTDAPDFWFGQFRRDDFCSEGKPNYDLVVVLGQAEFKCQKHYRAVSEGYYSHVYEREDL